MRITGPAAAQGNVLLCVLATITVVSLLGANVLLNCTTRFNAATSQVRAWKASLYAAEAGGDIAYAEIRKTILDPANAFSPAAGWTNSGPINANSTVTCGQDNLTTTS